MLTLARVLDRATDLSSIPKTISPAVRHTLKMCLEKDPKRRIADIRVVRELDELEARRIAGAENTPLAPQLYPGGGQLFYLEATNSRGVRLSIAGGVPTPVFTAANSAVVPDAVTLNWLPNGHMLLSHRGGISDLEPNESGLPVRMIDFGEERWTSGAQLLPDGDTVVYAVRDALNGFDSARIVAQRLSGGLSAEAVEIVPRGHDPRYLDSGHLLFVLDGVVRAVAFDSDALETSGDSEPVLTDVATGQATGLADYSIAADGTLAYIPAEAASPTDGSQVGLAWLAEDGTAEALPIDAPQDALQARASHDGQRLAVSGLFEGSRDIYVFDNLTRAGGGRRITRDPGNDIRPVWTTDDRRIVYYNDGAASAGIYWRAANGQGEAELLWAKPEEFGTIWPNWIHPDGNLLVFAMQSPAGGVGLWQIALEPGSEPFWSAGGDTLYYIGRERQIMRVDVALTPDVRIGEPEWVSNLRAIGGNAGLPNYDYDPAARRFLARSVPGLTVSAGADQSIVIVQNWVEWLKREVPTD